MSSNRQQRDRSVSVAPAASRTGKVVQAFSQGRRDRPVLLATSLVENGLDLPRCNTIVVRTHGTDWRRCSCGGGSVAGRSRPWPCSCILPIPKDVGSWHRLPSRPTPARPELARRDLEIRGAGALLGTKQSGGLLAP